MRHSSLVWVHFEFAVSKVRLNQLFDCLTCCFDAFHYSAVHSEVAGLCLYCSLPTTIIYLMASRQIILESSWNGVIFHLLHRLELGFDIISFPETHYFVGLREINQDFDEFLDPLAKSDTRPNAAWSCLGHSDSIVRCFLEGEDRQCSSS